MAEYWKSTPKYWCKHCSVYVRDTKLERQNHDATAKHQGAVKRALRDLHRGHEKEEREKDRAKREIERLNGVVSSSSAAATAGSASVTSASTSSAPGTGANATRPRFGGASSTAPGALPESERKRQAEQLASLGVSLPDEFRRDLAMAGDWQVTTTTILQDNPDDAKAGATARGVHKRERTEEQLEEEEAVKSLFKKPRRWGRDSRTVGDDSAAHDLDALLSGGLTVKKKEEGEKGEIDEKKDEKQEGDKQVKNEDDGGPSVKAEEEQPPIKEEPSDETGPLPAEVPAMVPPSAEDAGVKSATARIKTEDGEGAPEPTGGADPPTVVFKKRKPKNIRQK
ncbi:hypothetical protein VMCG_10337 [Cytospora schulzeri]|uniref:U1-type domain-containing protein n=1 Tax=Cytospora schulzeri TaxID=448051 RepID=A0A423VFF1_9PEZI|nr:hypothetical protein VMCG_10337 [Valsa malicola]